MHLIAPSGANPESLRSPKAIGWLEQQGIEVFNAECTKRVEQRFAGTDAERLHEINHLACVSPEVLVLAMRGGYGLHRLLPQIEWQAIARTIRQGLQICGHSDFTAFQLGMLAKTGAVTLAGPMLNVDFAPQDGEGVSIDPNAFMWKHFQTAVHDRVLNCRVEAPQGYLGNATNGHAQGLLWGGNLTVLVSVLGTPYFPNADVIDGGILFLEDVNEHPYRIERMLIQLLDAGVLANQSAILLGEFSAYRLYEHDRGYNLDQAISLIRQRLPMHIPLITGLPFGHEVEKLTLPVGAQAQVQYDPQGFAMHAQW